MTATGAFNELRDCQDALERALESARNLAEELKPGRTSRAIALAEQIENTIALCARITMYAKADALTGNPHAFADGLSEWADYLIETGRIYQ